ncbi:retrovirus-related pol polyprotein from transposon TNT 1-94 [Tanacetum coccineum]
MSGTIPPIPPPFGASSGNPGSPNVNRVDTMPTTTDPINTTTTTNVSQSVVDENLPQLLDSRGGSHVTNVPAFDKEDFTSWKVRFLVFLDGLEPYLLKTLEDGPFVPMSSLSTSKNPLPKRQNQWSNAESRLANQDKRLKSIIISCLPNDVIKSVIKCKTAKEMWNDLIYGKLQPLDLSSMLLNHLKDSDSDVEEDQRTSNEFMADLNAEYHEKDLLANQKRFYKRSGRVGSAKKPLDKTKETCFACGKLGHFQKECLLHKNSTPSYPSPNNSFNKSKPYTSSFNQTSSQNSGNHQKDYKGKYKGLKAKMVVLTNRNDDMTKGKSEKGQKDKEKSEKGLLVESFDWDDESVSSDDKGSTKIKAFMAITEDEPSVGKADARSGQWVDITMKKIHRLLSITDGESGKVKGYPRPNRESESALIFLYLLYTLCLHSEDDTERLKTSVNQNVEEEKDAEFVAIEEVAVEQSLEILTVEQLLDEADKLNKVVQETPESPYDTESEIKVVKSFFTSHISELKDQTMHDSEEIADIHEGSNSDLQSMHDDDLRFVSGFHIADSDDTHENEVSNYDHIFQDDNASTEHLSLPDHMDHICEEVSSLHSRLEDMESSIVQQVSAEFKSSLLALVTYSLKEQLPSLLSDALKDTLPQLLKDSIKSSVSKSIIEELPHVEARVQKNLQDQLPNLLLKPMYKEFNAFNKLESQRFVLL